MGARSQQGQAAVETAIILPLMTFMVLGTMQLTMLQQAQLMTEYAAFQAARAGIVWNCDKKKMEAAARVALAPTVPKSSLFPLVVTGGGKIQAGSAGMLDVAEHVEALEATNAIGSLAGLPILRIEIIHPTKAEAMASIAAHNNGVNGPGAKELDFDDTGYFKPGSSNKFDGFAGDDAYRHATLLTIRVRYLYEMRIPFADWIIQNCWFAAQAPKLLELRGSLGRETVGNATSVTGGDADATAALEAAAAAVIKDSAGKTIVSKADYLKLYALGKTQRWFLFPLVATYTMRMQSNVYVDNLP